jgi:hypothetical protein
MSVSGVTAAARTALANTITAAGLTCLEFDLWDQRNTIAGLGTARWEPTGMDQRTGIKSIVFPVLIYQLISANVDASTMYQDTNVETVFNAIGADPTLGNKCPLAVIEGDAEAVVYRTESGQAYSVAMVNVRVTPFANAA